MPHRPKLFEIAPPADPEDFRNWERLFISQGVGLLKVRRSLSRVVLGYVDYGGDINAQFIVEPEQISRGSGCELYVAYSALIPVLDNQPGQQRSDQV